MRRSGQRAKQRRRTDTPRPITMLLAYAAYPFSTWCAGPRRLSRPILLGRMTCCWLRAAEKASPPNVTGLENVLAAVDPDRLRLLVTFGSLIARTGLRGEADYGVANEWLRGIVERWKDRHRACRCLHLDWSVWSGAGMGERLGRLDLLMQQGITPIPIEEGLRILRELLKRDLPMTSLVVAGRFGDPPTLSFDRQELPFLRFLEKIRAHTPGVELIADAELSVESDPYLNDHIFDGERLLPGVMGLDAMAQVAGPLL